MKPSRRASVFHPAVFLICLMVCTLSPVYPQTLIGGTCSRDTTFALSGSPYTLFAALNIYNCTVTFERGATIDLQEYAISVGYQARPGFVIAEGVTFSNSGASDTKVSFIAGSGGTLRDCIFDNVYVYIVTGAPSIFSCTFENVENPFRFNSENAHPVISGNTYPGLNNPRILLYSSFDITQSDTLKRYEIPYVLFSGMSVSGCTLTVPPGVNIDLNGKSITIGQSAKPAFLNADGTVFINSAPGDQYIRFDYGSGGAVAGCTFDNVCLAVTDGAPVVHTSNFLNTSKGITNSGAQVVSAENNYWGDPSGPSHASNPGGKGVGVSDNVDFYPWLPALFTVESGDGVAEEPPGFTVSAPYPNPFNPATTIRYTIPEDCAVELVIYDIRGAKVAVLASGLRKAGRHDTVWNGKTQSGAEAASGMYLYRLKAGGYTARGKATLVR